MYNDTSFLISYLIFMNTFIYITGIYLKWFIIIPLLFPIFQIKQRKGF